jgi:hypothetical protein
MLSDSKKWNISTRPISARIDEDLLDSLQKLGLPKNTVINYILREYLVTVEKAILDNPRLAATARWRRYYKAQVSIEE